MIFGGLNKRRLTRFVVRFRVLANYSVYRNKYHERGLNVENAEVTGLVGYWIFFNYRLFALAKFASTCSGCRETNLFPKLLKH